MARGAYHKGWYVIGECWNLALVDVGAKSESQPSLSSRLILYVKQACSRGGCREQSRNPIYCKHHISTIQSPSIKEKHMEIDHTNPALESWLGLKFSGFFTTG